MVGSKYIRHASQLLKNQTGHQDLSENQQEQLLNNHPSPRPSESKDIRKPGAKFQISDQTSEGGQPQGKSDKPTRTTHLKGQHKEALPPTTQRASISTRAPEVVIPPPTRSLRARETLKPASKFADEFSGLGSKKIN